MDPEANLGWGERYFKIICLKPGVMDSREQPDGIII